MPGTPVKGAPMGTREVPGLRRAAAIDRELLKTLTDGGSDIVDRGRFGEPIRTTRTHLSRTDAASREDDVS